jgi:heme/copper-type cytochrome/quinol oxidase subunit 2
MLTDVSDRSQSGQTMKRLILWAIVPIVIVACALAYWLGPDLFARQTLTIANESERAVTVMIYDHVWTMTPGETVGTGLRPKAMRISRWWTQARARPSPHRAT